MTHLLASCSSYIWFPLHKALSCIISASRLTIVQELRAALYDCLQTVKVLTIEHAHVGSILLAFESSFVDLIRLDVRNQSELLCRFALHRILSQDTPNGPRQVSLHRCQLVFLPSLATRSLETFHLTECSISAECRDARAILEVCPAMREISFCDVRWAFPITPSPVTDTKTLFHLSLRSYTETPNKLIPNADHSCLCFDQLNVPGLETLTYTRFLPSPRFHHPLFAAGLELARPNLTSLDLSRSNWHPALLEAFGTLLSLSFLNMSFCGIDDGVIVKLERRGAEDDLLPNLRALSLAGNDISAGAVRYLVDSRLPVHLRYRNERHGIPAKRMSSFLPTAPSQSQDLTAIAVEPTPDQWNNRAKLPSISWLNVDVCERIDPAAADMLRKHVRFVSSACGRVVDDRIRGEGAWAWDADWTEKCGNGASNDCQLRKVDGESQRHISV